MDLITRTGGALRITVGEHFTHVIELDIVGRFVAEVWDWYSEPEVSVK